MAGIREFHSGRISKEELDALYGRAIRDTIERFEATGSPVITDGEQTKPSFATYPIQGAENLAPDGVEIEFADGHSRRLPRLTGGPFRYQTYAYSYLEEAQEQANVPIKQAVIAPSAISLIYPEAGIESYPHEQFVADLLDEAEKDIRGCLERGAHKVQVDFTEGRLAAKIDPSKGLLRKFIELNNRLLDRFSAEETERIGIHTCPGGDQDSTHSADVDYAELLPDLFKLKAGHFYMQLASEEDRRRVLGIVKEHSKPDQTIFVGVIDPIDPEVETAARVKERVLEAAEFIDPGRLGTTDDCGFSPFGDDQSTARETAFAKIRARVEGTRLAEKELGV